MTVLVHLSDIHFRKNSGNPYDLDSDLRNELERDATQVATELGPPDAVLVGGDIAYSGQVSEFKIAKEWLDKFCKCVGVTFANVWCVPGNHDVDQNAIRTSPVLFSLQDVLRGLAPSQHDQKLLDYMGDPIGGSQLYSSISAFNSFAEPYGFSFSPERPCCAVDLPLNDGSILRVCGLNSTVVSNHLDQRVKSVLLGKHQLPRSISGITNLLLCHHPPDWWNDDDSLKDAIPHRASIQLYGHKHRQSMRFEENSLKLSAGAVHPERGGPEWQPRYNWLQVDVEGASVARTLKVSVFPRVWNEGTANFIADFNNCNGQSSKTYSLALEEWTPPNVTTTVTASTSSPSGDTGVSMPQPTPLTDPERILTFRLIELPYLTRLAIAQSLALIQNEDSHLREYELFRKVLERAVAQDKLADLWDAVGAASHDDGFHVNPFRKSSTEAL